MKIGEIDNLGRVVIPVAFRKRLNLTENSQVTMSVSDNSVIITPNESLCRLCGYAVDKKSKIPSVLFLYKNGKIALK